MKILIISFYYFPEIGAAPSRITNMAEELQRRGAEVDVLTCMPNYPKGKIFYNYRDKFYKKENINGVNVYMYWVYATISKKSVTRMLSMISFALTLWVFGLKRSKIKKYDKVIIQTPPLLVAYSAVILFRKVYRKYTILNVSDLWPISAIELGAIRKGSFVHKIFAHVEKYIYKYSSAFQCQSNEIIEHIKGFEPNKAFFLYRNLQHHILSNYQDKKRKTPFMIVYAGLLGVAQDILELIQNINFKEIGAEFHIYGAGNQASLIKEYINNNDIAVIYHGSLPKDRINQELMRYNASIVPLVTRIRGAVPSKIFDLLSIGVPIIFCGGGEGAEIVYNYNLGVISQPRDYCDIKKQIIYIMNMNNREYSNLVNNCIEAANNDFSFDKQMEKYYKFLLESNL